MTVETNAVRNHCVILHRGHESYITCVATFAQFVYTGSNDGTIRKWDMATCDCLYVYRGHHGKIHKLLVIDDFIFSTSNDKTARVWLNEPKDKKPCIRIFKVIFFFPFPANLLQGSNLISNLNFSGPRSRRLPAGVPA